MPPARPLAGIGLHPAAALEAVERDCEQQDEADDHALPEHADGVDDHGVLDERDEQHAEYAADDRALAALQAGAAEHGGGDDLELDADAGIDHRAVQPSRTEHARDA